MRNGEEVVWARPSGMDAVGGAVAGDASCEPLGRAAAGGRCAESHWPGLGRAFGLWCGYPGLVPQWDARGPLVGAPGRDDLNVYDYVRHE